MDSCRQDKCVRGLRLDEWGKKLLSVGLDLATTGVEGLATLAELGVFGLTGAMLGVGGGGMVRGGACVGKASCSLDRVFILMGTLGVQ